MAHPEHEHHFQYPQVTEETAIGSAEHTIEFDTVDHELPEGVVINLADHRDKKATPQVPETPHKAA